MTILRSDYDEPELRDAIAGALGGMNRDELRCLAFIAEGLQKGRKLYGPMNLALNRPWSRELAEEYRDGAIYWAAMTLAWSIDRGE